jgi:hypothetical protein
VQIGLEAPLSRLCSFARWLPKHAALLKSITISTPASPQPQFVDGLQWGLHLEAAQQLLQQALQLSTALPAAAAAHCTSAAQQQQEEQQQQQQQQPLPPPNISSITMTGNAGMLAALPAHSLTHLNILELLQPVNYAAVSAALAKLSNLRQLHIGDPAISLNCAASLAQLSQLTLLELDGFGYYTEAEAEQLQLLLVQPLPLQVLRMPDFGCHSDSPGLDLSQVTQLLEFSVGLSMKAAVLPSQLQQLQIGEVRCDKDFTAILQLQQLQRLIIRVAAAKLEWLLSLAKLPDLQFLA